MNSKKILTLFALLPFTAMAQTWTLQRCLDYAAEHNITVQKNRLSEEDAAEQLKQTKAALFPTLSFSMSQSLGYRPFQESTVMVQNGMATSTNNMRFGSMFNNCRALRKAPIMDVTLSGMIYVVLMIAAGK